VIKKEKKKERKKDMWLLKLTKKRELADLWAQSADRQRYRPWRRWISTASRRSDSRRQTEKPSSVTHRKYAYQQMLAVPCLYYK